MACGVRGRLGISAICPVALAIKFAIAFAILQLLKMAAPIALASMKKIKLAISITAQVSIQQYNIVSY